MFMNITTLNNNFRCTSHDCHYIQALFHSMYKRFLSMTSGFHQKVNENWTLVGYYTARRAILLLTFQDNILVPRLGVKNPKDMMSPICCPKNVSKKLPLHMFRNTKERTLKLLSQVSTHTSQRTHTVRIYKKFKQSQFITHREDNLS